MSAITISDRKAQAETLLFSNSPEVTQLLDEGIMSPESGPGCSAPSCGRGGERPDLLKHMATCCLDKSRDLRARNPWGMASREGTARISAPAALGLLGSNGSPRLRTDLFIVWLDLLPGVMVRRSGENLSQCACKSRLLFAKALISTEGKMLMAMSVGSFPKLQKRKVGQRAYKGWNLDTLGSVPIAE